MPAKNDKEQNKRFNKKETFCKHAIFCSLIKMFYRKNRQYFLQHFQNNNTEPSKL